VHSAWNLQDLQTLYLAQKNRSNILGMIKINKEGMKWVPCENRQELERGIKGAP